MTGTTLPVFLGLTVVVMGGAAALTGQALARGWRPALQVLPAALLLGLFDRFLTWGLFGGALLSLPGFLIDTGLILAIALAAHRATLAAKMVRQYPWLYERAGPFGWRARSESGA